MQRLSNFVPLFLPDSNKASKLICAVISALWLFGQFDAGIGELLALSPANLMSVHFYVWIVATAGFFERSFALGLANIVAAVFITPFIERYVVPRAFLRFALMVNLSIFVSLFLALFSAFALTSDERWFFRSVSGTSGLLAACVVALKQRYPQKALIAPLRLTVDRLPAMVCIGSVLLSLAQIITPSDVLLVHLGTYFGWLYLRFFLPDRDTALVGDMRDEFTFASLFLPIPRLQKLVGIVANVSYKLAPKFIFRAAVTSHEQQPAVSVGSGLLTSLTPATPSSSVSTAVSAATAATLPVRPVIAPLGSYAAAAAAGGGLKPADFSVVEPAPVYKPLDPNAERRRLLAMKAIDEKLAQIENAPGDDNDELSAYLSNSSLNAGSAALLNLSSDDLEAEAARLQP